jgi:D-aminopeptidase
LPVEPLDFHPQKVCIPGHAPVVAPARRLTRRPPPGIVVVATDAPLRAEQLERVARRAGLGLARTGSVAHHGSGEIFIAFSTARDAGAVADGELDPLFTATVDATEEAVLNALWSAERVVGREGRVAEPLPYDEVVALLRAHQRL